MDSANATCKDVVRLHKAGRVADIRAMLEAERAGAEHPELGPLNEYGLCFDYVAPGTFKGQRRGYFRYQISWGGPSDEFRFFCDERLEPVRIEYWFLDWNDGAKVILTGKDEELLRELWDDWKDCEVPQLKMAEAIGA